MSYKVEWTNRALKDLRKLDKQARALVLSWVKNKLEAIADPCGLANAKPLEGIEHGWRWRIGSYRVVGVVEKTTITITLFRAGHRRDVYRNLPKKLR